MSSQVEICRFGLDFWCCGLWHLPCKVATEYFDVSQGDDVQLIIKFRSHVRLDTGTDHSTCWPVGRAQMHTKVKNVTEVVPNRTCFSFHVASGQNSGHSLFFMYSSTICSLKTVLFHICVSSLLKSDVESSFVFSATSYIIFPQLFTMAHQGPFHCRHCWYDYNREGQIVALRSQTSKSRCYNRWCISSKCSR